jgi:hypothetical protein
MWLRGTSSTCEDIKPSEGRNETSRPFSHLLPLTLSSHNCSMYATMFQARLSCLLRVLALWIVCVAGTDYSTNGIHINCVPEIEAARCMSYAAAENHLARRTVDCGKVTGVLSAVKALGPLATAFCSTYLHIPGTTTVQTTTTPPRM